VSCAGINSAVMMANNPARRINFDAFIRFRSQELCRTARHLGS
jgi:hypothetical protein